MGNSKPCSVAKMAGCPVVEAMYRSAVGVDVHAELLVCSYQSYDPQTSLATTEAAEFGTTCSQLRQFAARVRERNPQIVLMESTGVLWRSPYEALEEVGFTSRELALVNARDVKAATGRKTDHQDARRLAEYARFGKFKKSFVPPRIFRDMRNVSRLYIRQRNNYAREKNRYQKLFNSIGCRARTVFSDINGKSARKILDAFIDGDVNFLKTIDRCRGRLKASAEEIFDALNFSVSPAMLQVLRVQRRTVERCESECLATFEILREMQEPYEAVVQLLMTIPCVKEISARLLLAEFTDDLSSFPTSEHFCSWLGICPGNNKSAGKAHGGSTPKGNKWARAALTEIAHGIGLSKGNPFRERFQVFKERRGTKRAIVAIAHKIARLIYGMIKTGEPFHSTECGALRNHRIRKVARDLAQARKDSHIDITSSGIVDTATGAVLIPASCCLG